MNAEFLAAAATFALSAAVVFKYRILPIDGTPYWLFTLFFLLNAASVYAAYTRTKAWEKSRIFTGLFLAVIAVSLFAAFFTAIMDRGINAPGQAGGVHDIILQLESAVKYLGDGMNPYKATYFGTPLENWYYAENGVRAVNPALYHFVMPPWYLVFSYPFYYAGMRLVGFFDGRMPLVFTAAGIVAVILLWFRKRSVAHLAVLAVLFAPAQVEYLLEGRSDIFVLFWFLLSLYLLEKRHFLASVVTFAVAVLSKQTAWFAVPYYFMFLSMHIQGNIGKLVKYGVVFLLVLAVIAGPFMFWDPAAFIGSTVFYLNGNTSGSYPVSGYGLGMLLYEAGVIKNIHDQYPFFIWQILFGLPALYVGMKFMRERKTASSFLMAYALLLFAVWYGSRYFNNSHAVFVASVMVLAALKSWDEKVAV